MEALLEQFQSWRIPTRWKLSRKRAFEPAGEIPSPEREPLSGSLEPRAGLF